MSEKKDKSRPSSKKGQKVASKKASSKKDSDKGSKKGPATDVTKFINKQRTLIFSSRGISHRDRHLLTDLLDMLPHSKKDNKFDEKEKLSAINEVADMRGCNNVIFFEARKKSDLYMWFTRTPYGPSIKFLVQNVHTMSEIKLTGNCLKGSRPLMIFDQSFDSAPQYKLMREMFQQIMGSPKGHPKVKPFIDHAMSFFVCDDRIWLRNYQIIEPLEGPAAEKKDPQLVEIGPRFVLQPIKILAGSFSGAVLWENKEFQSPNELRRESRKRKMSAYEQRQQAKDKRKKHKADNPLQTDQVDEVFREADGPSPVGSDDDDEEEGQQRRQEQEQEEEEESDE